MVLAQETLLRRAFLARLQYLKVLARTRPTPRLFTQKSRLLVLSRGAPRPQLPFLHPTTASRLTAPLGHPPNHLTRFISSESTGYYRDIVTRGAKLCLVAVGGMALYAAAGFLHWTETMGREFPAPPEWRWKMRVDFSKAAADQLPDDEGKPVDWAHIGSIYEKILQELEDPSKLGKGLRPLLDDDGETWVEGVRKAGLDLSEKSEPWRRGYHACLMGAAKAAEQVEGWVYDTETKLACHAQYMIGPSNPTPTPWPYLPAKPPLEEKCKPLLPAPDALYIKIITSQGFTSRQRLEAALAYADWLEFKGLPSTAEDMYDWALDIAAGALPMDANHVVDLKTGIISGKATYVSANILTATTALAMHHARNNNPSAALQIFISILRARRHLLLPAPPPKPVQEPQSVQMYALTAVRTFLTTPPYPPPPPTGDEVPSQTPAEICEEAAVMSSIGEILFASSSFKRPPLEDTADSMLDGPKTPAAPTTKQLEQFQSGLSWTREAVDVAEETLNALSFSDEDEAARSRCGKCLAAGIENWTEMVRRMLADERAAVAKEALTKKEGGNGYSASVFQFWGVKDGNGDGGGDIRNRWEGESRVVEARVRRIQRMLARERERNLPFWMTVLHKTRDL